MLTSLPAGLRGTPVSQPELEQASSRLDEGALSLFPAQSLPWTARQHVLPPQSRA